MASLGLSVSVRVIVRTRCHLLVEETDIVSRSVKVLC